MADGYLSTVANVFNVENVQYVQDVETIAEVLDLRGYGNFPVVLGDALRNQELGVYGNGTYLAVGVEGPGNENLAAASQQGPWQTVDDTSDTTPPEESEAMQSAIEQFGGLPEVQRVDDEITDAQEEMDANLVGTDTKLAEMYNVDGLYVWAWPQVQYGDTFTIPVVWGDASARQSRSVTFNPWTAAPGAMAVIEWGMRFFLWGLFGVAAVRIVHATTLA